MILECVGCGEEFPADELTETEDGDMCDDCRDFYDD